MFVGDSFVLMFAFSDDDATELDNATRVGQFRQRLLEISHIGFMLNILSTGSSMPFALTTNHHLTRYSRSVTRNGSYQS